MNKTAVIYKSVHHNNTMELIRSAQGIDIYEADKTDGVDFSVYALVGLASGIYMGKFHKSIYRFAQEHAGELKNVFLVYTSGSGSEGYGKSFKKILVKNGFEVKGAYSCKGYDTYGPWRIFGGLAKNHPDGKDKEKFVKFLENMEQEEQKNRD